tara:strand:+ start:1677 stop:2417 length:741 start_codon:yes stop_codon:yes gene_type:complete
MKVLLIGESCLDVFHYGECKRLCPEAPAPVFNSLSTIQSEGMASNVYNNIKQLTNSENIKLITNANYQNIKKTRFVEEKSNHMFLRLDENDKDYGRLKNIKNINFSKYDGIIISDYNKGFLSNEDMKYISENSKLSFLDTKRALGEWSMGFTFVKINKDEFERTKHSIGKSLMRKLIITEGSKGCIHAGKRYTVPSVEVKDVSGAGDSFLAAFSHHYIMTENVEASIIFANDCATRVVQKRAVSTL